MGQKFNYMICASIALYCVFHYAPGEEFTSFNIGPEHVGTFIPNKDLTLSTEGKCWAKIKLSFKYSSSSHPDDILVKIEKSGKKHTFCIE